MRVLFLDRVRVTIMSYGRTDEELGRGNFALMSTARRSRLSIEYEIVRVLPNAIVDTYKTF